MACRKPVPQLGRARGTPRPSIPLVYNDQDVAILAQDIQRFAIDVDGFLRQLPLQFTVRPNVIGQGTFLAFDQVMQVSPAPADDLLLSLPAPDRANAGRIASLHRLTTTGTVSVSAPGALINGQAAFTIAAELTRVDFTFDGMNYLADRQSGASTTISPPGDVTISPAGDVIVNPTGDIVLKDLSGILRADLGVVSVHSQAASTLVGRAQGAGAGSPGTIALGPGLSLTGDTLSVTPVPVTDADYGDISVSLSGTVWTIDPGAVTYAKIQDVTASRLLGRGSAAGDGDVVELTAGTGLTISGTLLSSTLIGVSDGDKGDVTVSSTGTVWTIDVAAVTDAKLRDSGALSVIGRSVNTSGVPGDIAGSASSDAVLRVSGTTLGFGTVATAGITDAAVTYAKVQDVTATRVLGRGSAAGAGPPVELTVSTGLSLSGTVLSCTVVGINDGDKGDITVSGTGATWTIDNDAVSYAKIQNVSAASRVLGRGSAGGAGDVEELTIGSGLTLTGTVLSAAAAGIADADYGDITVTTSGSVWTIDADVVTYAKMQNVSAASRLLGRGSAGGAGDPEEITIGSGLTMTGTALSAVASGIADADYGDITVTGGGATWTIDAGVVTLAKMANIATDRLIGRDTAATGVPEALTVTGGVEFTGAGGIQTSAFTGDVTKSAGGTVLTHAANSVINTVLRDSVALSVIGRSSNSTGDPADISGTASSDQVLRVSGTTLGFGTIATAGIADSAVTLVKIQTIATDRLLGRDTAATGVVEQLTVGGGVEFTGSGGIQRSALTGDVTATAGSGATTIANNVVSDAKLRQSAAVSVIGRSAATTGNIADISSGFDGAVLRQSGTTLGFGTIATGGIADAAVTLAKIQTIAANTVIANATAGTASPTAVAIGTNTFFGRVGGNIQTLNGANAIGIINLETTVTWGGSATTSVAISPTGTNAGITATSVGSGNIDITSARRLGLFAGGAANEGGANDVSINATSDVLIGATATVNIHPSGALLLGDGTLTDSITLDAAGTIGVFGTSIIIGDSATGTITAVGTTITLNASSELVLEADSDISAYGTGPTSDMYLGRNAANSQRSRSMRVACDAAMVIGDDNCDSWTAQTNGAMSLLPNAALDLGDSGTDNVNIGTQTRFTAYIQPTLSADQNNWNPSGLATCNVMRVVLTGTHRSVTGLVAQPNGTIILLFNVTPATDDFNLTLVAGSASSTAANRFEHGVDNVVIKAGYGAFLYYDEISARWRILQY